MEDEQQESSVLGDFVKLPGLFGGHATLTGSVTDRLENEDPQEILAALIAERENNPEPAEEEEENVHEDPLPGNITHPFHGVCRSQYPPTIPNLKVRQIWKSKKMRRYSDVTLVTHLSLDMLSKLEYQCEHWTSRVAAAVYVKLPYDEEPVENPFTKKVNETLASAEETVDAFFTRAQELPCTMDILLAYEEYNSADVYFQLYPINALRNRAIQLADAEHVLVTDVDVVPNDDLAHDLHIISLYETLSRVTGNRQVIVLPVITVTGSEEDPLTTLRWANRSLEGVERVQVMYEKGKIKQFETIRSPQAQWDTDLAQWFNSTRPYRLKEIHPEYEPYYLAKKETLPWYDERFRGLKINRALHTWHLYKSGFTFVVTPRAYVVHVPHIKGLTWLETRRRGHYKKMMRMYTQALTDIEEDSYDPVTLFSCLARRSPKWTWY